MENCLKINKRKPITKYHQKLQMIIVENMAEDDYANAFFRAFFDFCNMEASSQKSRKLYTLKVNKEQLKYIEDSTLPGVNILDKGNSWVQIECEKKDKDKLDEDMEALDEINEFYFENPEVLDQIKSI